MFRAVSIVAIAALASDAVVISNALVDKPAVAEASETSPVALLCTLTLISFEVPSVSKSPHYKIKRPPRGRPFL